MLAADPDPKIDFFGSTTNPLDHMFQHAFMFNRDLSKWKISNTILWAQNFLGMTGTIRNSRGNAKPHPQFNQVLCSKLWVDLWEVLDKPDEVNDRHYDPTWLDFWEKSADKTDGLLTSMSEFDETPKINFFLGTAGKILCCSKGEQFVPSNSRPSEAKCVGCGVGQYQDLLFTKPETCVSEHLPIIFCFHFPMHLLLQFMNAALH